jgi:hypothetical protein
LFFADALDRADALGLLQAIIERSRERVAALNRIEPEARSLSEKNFGLS